MGVSRRKVETQRLTHEAMREKISFAHTLNDIIDAEAKLRIWSEQEEPPSNGHIGAIRTLLDSKWKKLNKLLPDLKAVEHSGADGGAIAVEHVIKFDDDE